MHVSCFIVNNNVGFFFNVNGWNGTKLADVFYTYGWWRSKILGSPQFQYALIIVGPLPNFVLVQPCDVWEHTPRKKKSRTTSNK